MTKLEAMRAALSAAVRDGDREVARALTVAVLEEMGYCISSRSEKVKPLMLVRNQGHSPKGDVLSS